MKKIPLTKEYLEQKIKIEKLNHEQISKESGWCISWLAKKIREFGLSQKRSLKGLDLIGRRFGKMTVIDKAERLNHCNRWKCICDCGNERSVSTGNLLAFGTCSCGCVRVKKGKENKGWMGKEELSGKYFCILKSNAGKRGYVFDVEIEYLWDLFEIQNKKCALTGWEIDFSPKNQTASLDRIDNTKGYTKGNLQWLHKDVNKAKNVHDEKYFIEMCEAIARNQQNNLTAANPIVS